MNYLQVRDILKRVRGYHRQFQETLSQIEQMGGNGYAEWVAYGLQRHEQHWQLALARFDRDAEQTILNTWLQFVPDETIRDELDSMVVTSSLSEEDVTDLAIRFHHALAEFYATLVASVAVPRLQEIFTRLMELENTVTAERAWAARPD